MVVGPDTTGPAITINRPLEGGQYVSGQALTASYSCDDGHFGTGDDTCVGNLANGATIDTSAGGPFTFEPAGGGMSGPTVRRSI